MALNLLALFGVVPDTPVEQFCQQIFLSLRVGELKVSSLLGQLRLHHFKIARQAVCCLRLQFITTSIFTYLSEALGTPTWRGEMGGFLCSSAHHLLEVQFVSCTHAASRVHVFEHVFYNNPHQLIFVHQPRSRGQPVQVFRKQAVTLADVYSQ